MLALAILTLVLFASGIGALALDHHDRVFAYPWGQRVGIGLMAIALVLALAFGLQGDALDYSP